MAKNKKIEEASIVDEEEKVEKKKTRTKVHKVTRKEHVEKAFFVQRFAAFIIDIFIISMIASILAYPFLDMESIQKLNESSTEVVNDYMSQDISMDDYVSESVSISYEMAKKQGVLSLITIFLNILYFVVFQLKNNGQTLGKQLLKIKVVSNDDSELTTNQLIFRSLIINSILIDMVSFAMLLFASRDVYFYGAGFLGMVQFGIIVISGFMIMGKTHRGIHDLVAHTDVVRSDVVKEMETCEN